MKVVDIVIGLLILVMGLWKYIMSVEALGKVFSFIGNPGDNVYNIILIVAGLILIIYGARRPMPLMIRR